MRKSIITFFDKLHLQLDELQKTKLDQFNKIFKETNSINVAKKAQELSQKSDKVEDFFL